LKAGRGVPSGGTVRAPGARLFVALELPACAREALAAWGARCADADPALRALREDALHLTLCFLGSRPEEQMAGIGAAVARCAGPAPLLSLAGAEWLPESRPRVLAVGVRDADGTLGRLRERVAQALVARGRHRLERRRFHPHVTVARVRRGERPRPVGPEPPDLAELRCDALTLFRSHLGGGPARYEALARVALVEVDLGEHRAGKE